MTKVTMHSWREGLKKVSLTHAQKELLGLNLKASKDNTDALLDGKEIVFEIENHATAILFCEKVEKLGVKCTFTLL